MDAMLPVSQVAPPSIATPRPHETPLAGQASSEEWDAFVRNHPESYLEQISAWAQVKADQGWHVRRLCLRQGGAIIGGAQILEKRMGRFFKVGYLSRGPLLNNPADLPSLIDALKSLSASRRYSYLAISLPYSSHDAVPPLEAAGFQRRPPQMPPTVWARATSVLDLTQDLEMLSSDMSSTMRKHIRRAFRAGVVVREGDAHDLPQFCALVKTLCARRGVTSNMPGTASLRKLWDHLSPSGSIKLFMAEQAGRPLCGLIVIALGFWVRAWRIGWTGDEEKLYSTQAAYWTAIEWAKKQGYHHFDLMGLDERDVSELLLGRSREQPFHCSITQFKVGFGGQLLLLPGEFCYFPNPVARWLFNRVGARIAGHPLSRWATKRLLRSAG